MNLEKLLAALEELMKERAIIKNDFHWLIEYDELSNIISEILNTTNQNVGMQDIEKRVTHALKLDIENVENGLKIIEKAKPENITIRNDNPIHITPKEIILELQEFVEKYKSKEIDRINALMNFELFCDMRFNRVLMVFDSNNNIFNEMQNLLVKKLNLLDKDDILLLWAKIKSWFNTEDSNAKAFPIYKEIIPEGFFREQNNQFTIEEKCAHSIVKYIPLTMRMMVEEGVNMFPIGLPGVAKILAITDTSEMLSISNIEYLLIRSASQTVAVYESITNNKPADLAKNIGAEKNGLIFDGEYLSSYRKKIFDRKITDKNKNELLISNVKRLIDYTQLYTKQHTHIEKILRQYKMGEEVIHPRRKGEFDNIDGSVELYLQKDICKFLLERDILAFGKSIGRNQIDLYYKDIFGEDFVIETKIYNDNKAITLNNIKDNIVQLQSYMDQHDQPRGILAIFNFTDTLMMAPRKWFNGRIYLICINLCDLSASKRKSSIEIISSQSNLIDLITVEHN